MGMIPHARETREEGAEDKGVSELHAASDHLERMINEHGEIVVMLAQRLEPLLSIEKDHVMESRDLANVDPRSAHSRFLGEQAERIHDHTELLERLLVRLDV